MSNNLYLPQATVLEDNNFILERLSQDKNDEQLFIEETTRIISADYDEIKSSFAENIAKINRLGEDPFGYFTLGKEVWVIKKGSTSQIIGFEVITRKRGGSIKIGPTIVLPTHRGKGYASLFIETLLQEYQKAGVRKVYVTAPLNHSPTAGLDFRHLNFRLEAILNSHYKVGQFERVSGRFLAPENATPVKAIIGSPKSNVLQIKSLRITHGKSTFSEKEITELIVNTMQDYYDDIDEAFALSILRASENVEPLIYEKKPKILYTISMENELSGIIVCSPKRGGTLKIAPLLLNINFQTPEIIKLILDKIINDAIANQRRKISFLIPVQHWNILTALISCRLEIEGVLREPYKPGCDVVVLSLFLE